MQCLNVILLLGLFGAALGDHWGYPTPGPNGEIVDPENWGGQCDMGRKQSPIDLSFSASIRGQYDEFEFIEYDDIIPNAKVTNNGHTIQIDVGAPPQIILKGGGLTGSYVFDQMHFHWGSEHTLNGRRYALELHMVHHDSRFPTINEAISARYGIAVLGVLFHVSTLANEDLDNILNGVEYVVNNVSASADIPKPLAAGALLPRNTSSYFRYEGSLTTPSCGEAVIWTVYTQSLPISFDQLERLKNIRKEDGTELTNNFRSVQPLNSRSLVYVAPLSMDNSQLKEGSAIAHTPSLVILLLTAVLMLFAKC